MSSNPTRHRLWRRVEACAAPLKAPGDCLQRIGSSEDSSPQRGVKGCESAVGTPDGSPERGAKGSGSAGGGRSPHQTSLPPLSGAPVTPPVVRADGLGVVATGQPRAALAGLPPGGAPTAELLITPPQLSSVRRRCAFSMDDTEVRPTSRPCRTVRGPSTGPCSDHHKPQLDDRVTPVL